jgi:hypothetical protein
MSSQVRKGLEEYVPTPKTVKIKNHSDVDTRHIMNFIGRWVVWQIMSAE